MGYYFTRWLGSHVAEQNDIGVATAALFIILQFVKVVLIRLRCSGVIFINIDI